LDGEAGAEADFALQIDLSAVGFDDRIQTRGANGGRELYPRLLVRSSISNSVFKPALYRMFFVASVLGDE
jgi:hypothetical protein